MPNTIIDPIKEALQAGMDWDKANPNPTKEQAQAAANQWAENHKDNTLPLSYRAMYFMCGAW